MTLNGLIFTPVVILGIGKSLMEWVTAHIIPGSCVWLFIFTTFGLILMGSGLDKAWSIVREMVI